MTLKLILLAVAFLFIASPSWAERPHCGWDRGVWACEHGWSRDGDRERHEMWRDRHEMWRERHREREEMRDRERWEWCRYHHC